MFQYIKWKGVSNKNLPNRSVYSIKKTNCNLFGPSTRIEIKKVWFQHFFQKQLDTEQIWYLYKIVQKKKLKTEFWFNSNILFRIFLIDLWLWPLFYLEYTFFKDRLEAKKLIFIFMLKPNKWNYTTSREFMELFVNHFSSNYRLVINYFMHCT